MNRLIVTVAVIIAALGAMLGVMLHSSTPTQYVRAKRTYPDSVESTREEKHSVDQTVYRDAPGAMRPPLVAASADASDAGEVRRQHLTDEEENEAMAMADNSSRQRLWRSAYAHEREDEAWTRRTMQGLRKQAAELLDDRKLLISDLSCRETICRMYLQFEDQLDADAFRKAQRDPSLQYEFQSLDPDFKGEGFDRSDHTYEVMIQRPRSEGQPASVPEPSVKPRVGTVRLGDDKATVVSGDGS